MCHQVFVSVFTFQVSETKTRCSSSNSSSETAGDTHLEMIHGSRMSWTGRKTQPWVVFVSCQVLQNIYRTVLTSCGHHKALGLVLKIHFLFSHITLKHLKLLHFSSNRLGLFSHSSVAAEVWDVCWLDDSPRPKGFQRFWWTLLFLPAFQVQVEGSTGSRESQSSLWLAPKPPPGDAEVCQGFPRGAQGLSWGLLRTAHSLNTTTDPCLESTATRGPETYHLVLSQPQNYLKNWRLQLEAKSLEVCLCWQEAFGGKWLLTLPCCV